MTSLYPIVLPLSEVSAFGEVVDIGRRTVPISATDRYGLPSRLSVASGYWLNSTPLSISRSLLFVLVARQLDCHHEYRLAASRMLCQPSRMRSVRGRARADKLVSHGTIRISGWPLALSACVRDWWKLPIPLRYRLALLAGDCYRPGYWMRIGLETRFRELQQGVVGLSLLAIVGFTFACYRYETGELGSAVSGPWRV